MRKKYALSRIGAVALLASSAFGGANAQVRATQQSAPSISNTIMRVASEDGRKLWGNVLFDNRWASVSEDYYAYGWYEFMAKDPVKVKQLYTEDFFRATGSGA